MEKQPQIIFKGGTSLSKCYKLIQRFSEDIDLNLEYESRPTESQRRHLKENIVASINDLGFALTNPHEVKSRMNYNKYIVDFLSAFEFPTLKQYLCGNDSKPARPRTGINHAGHFTPMRLTRTSET